MAILFECQKCGHHTGKDYDDGDYTCEGGCRSNYIKPQYDFIRLILGLAIFALGVFFGKIF